MEKILILAVLMLGSVTNANAMDHRSQFSVGGALGGTFAAPWANEKFRDAVGAKLPAASTWVRYIPGTPEVGWELSYNYIALSKMDYHAHTAIMSFISRQNPWGSFHPFYAFGVGYANSSNWYATGEPGKLESMIFKITAGIEFEMNEHLDVGFHLNHYTIFKDKQSQQNLHAITPMLTVNYYFGTPAPLPPAAPPTPVPTAAAPAVVAPPAPAAEELKPAPAARPTTKAKAKAAAKAKQSAKKPVKKKKKKKTAVPEANDSVQ